jgi:predicted RNase H-like HicB family nuclease
MSRTKRHVALFERDDASDAWLVQIKDVDGCQTYGRSLHQASARIREALAGWLGCDPDELMIAAELPEDLAATAAEVARTRAEAEMAGTRAREVTVAAVRHLTGTGLSRRDAAELLGISHQRVQQLLAT